MTPGSALRKYKGIICEDGPALWWQRPPAPVLEELCVGDTLQPGQLWGLGEIVRVGTDGPGSVDGG